jgi:hypothetical protein
MVEFWGIIATLFVLASFLFNEEKYIRMVNIIGALIFVGYGIVLQAHSVWILNGVLVIVYVWKLVKMGRQKV